MSRDEMIDFIVQAIWDIEGVRVDRDIFIEKSDAELDKDVQWYDYLYGK